MTSLSYILVCIDRTRHRDTLLLTATDVDASLADFSLVTSWEGSEVQLQCTS